MKTYKLKFFILAFGTVFLTSCTTLLYTSLDVLRPAKIAFAPDANNLLMVNNTVTQPKNYGHKTQLLNEKTKNIILSSDSLSIFCLSALKEALEEKNFFTAIKLLPDSKNQNKDFGSLDRLDADSVKSLCTVNQTNVILSLDKIKVNDDLTEYYLTETSTYLATLELRIETFWSINYPNKPGFTPIQFEDTVYWESESYNRRKTVRDLPKRSDALIDGALNVGQKCVNRFVPYWEKVDRYFFNSPNRFMKQGMDSVYVKNWESAINSWEIAIKRSESAWIQAQAANNIAIAYEITGDVDKALEYMTQSFNSLVKLNFVDFETYIRISQYIEDLTVRKNEIATLKIQLGEK